MKTPPHAGPAYPCPGYSQPHIRLRPPAPVKITREALAHHRPLRSPRPSPPDPRRAQTPSRRSSAPAALGHLLPPSALFPIRVHPGAASIPRRRSPRLSCSSRLALASPRRLPKAFGSLAAACLASHCNSGGAQSGGGGATIREPSSSNRQRRRSIRRWQSSNQRRRHSNRRRWGSIRRGGAQIGSGGGRIDSGSGRSGAAALESTRFGGARELPCPRRRAKSALSRRQGFPCPGGQESRATRRSSVYQTPCPARRGEASAGRGIQAAPQVAVTAPPVAARWRGGSACSEVSRCHLGV